MESIKKSMATTKKPTAMTTSIISGLGGSGLSSTTKMVAVADTTAQITAQPIHKR
jgi:hypothetical protein